MKLKIFTLIASSLFVIATYIAIILNGYTSLYSLWTYIVLIILGTTLIYLSIEDIRSMEIPSVPIYSIFFFLILINILLILLGYNNIVVFKHFELNAINNLYGGIVGASISGLIYMLSNRKGLGEGDIYLFAIMGLMLGLERIVFGFYLALTSALIFALVQMLKYRRIKDIHIPFVPFIVFGTIAAILLHESYLQLRVILFI